MIKINQNLLAIALCFAVCFFPAVAINAQETATPPQQESEQKKDDKKKDDKKSDEEKPDNKKSGGKKNSLTKSARQLFFGNNRPDPSRKFSKRSDDFVGAFEPLVESVSASTVKVMSGRRQLALGTVVDSQGFILTKASELRGNLSCKFLDGRQASAKVLGIHPETDLAMLKVDLDEINVVQWSKSPTPIVGQWLITPNGQRSKLDIGVVSVNERIIPPSSAFIGINMEPNTIPVEESESEKAETEKSKSDKDLKPKTEWKFDNQSDDSKEKSEKDNDKKEQDEEKDGAQQMLDNMLKAIEERDGKSIVLPGIRITRVIVPSPASEAGLLRGDIIMSIDGTEVPGTQDLRDCLKNLDPGDRVELGVVRNERKRKFKLTLAARDKISPLNSRSNTQNRMGSVLSRRRKDFPIAFQHDSMLSNTDCGGPVVDLSGDVVGINIARAGRVSSLSLPAHSILPIIDQLKSGDLSPEIVNKERISMVSAELEDIESMDDSLPKKKEKLNADYKIQKAKRDELKAILAQLEKRMKDADAKTKDIRKQLDSASSELRAVERNRERLKSELKRLSTGVR